MTQNQSTQNPAKQNKETLEPTEIELILRSNPTAARKFISACAKGDLNLNDFSAAERGILLNACINAAFNPEEQTVVKALKEADWIREPVEPEEFLSNPKYLGEFSKMIYAPWRRDLEYVLNPKNEIFEWCLHQDTKVALLNGTNPTIKELADSNLDYFWVYSCDENGNVVPGKAHSARKTREKQKLIKVTLDNKEEIKCTLDHKFLMRNGSYKEAQYLQEGDSLMPLYRTYAAIELNDKKNHKVLKVEILKEHSDVYCMTIDKYHNFAVSAGIFLKNCLGGGIGTGKCSSSNTLVRTPQGDVPIKVLYQHKDSANYVEAESGFHKVLEYHDEGITNVIKIETKSGYNLECRPNHRIRVIDNNSIIWKASQDLGIGDLALISQKTGLVLPDPIISLSPGTEHCYDLSVENDPSYISNGFISHNTKSSIIAQLYKLYRLTCLRNIKAYYDLDPSTRICIGLFTLSLGKADTALAGDFRQLVSMSPYFRSIFPLKKMRTFKKVMNTQGDVKEDNYEVTLPQGLHVLMGSKVSHALSLAVISGILDEMNFRTKRTVKQEEDEDSAEALYNELNTRIKSRFNVLGHTPGLLCVISSKRSNSDFLEAHVAKVKNDPHVLISSYSQWDVKPHKYSKEKFYVFVGNSKTASRILHKDEINLYPEESPNIIAVPETLRRDFELDINSSLRQHAGIATSATQLLFEDPLLVKQAFDMDRVNIFPTQNIPIGLKSNVQIKDYINFQELCRDAGFAIVPKNHPSMLRVMHIDLSKSKDATGICMGGVSSLKEIMTKNSYGQYTVSSYVPEIWIDFVIGLQAPQGDQIDYEKIQQFINYLKSCKFNIHYITLDQYQSAQLIQNLVKDGYKTEHRSVDKDDIPYMMLREVFVNKNLSIPYNKYLEKELMYLVHDVSRGKGRIDHPKMFPDGTPGSKDRSDALSGVIANSYEILTNVKKFPHTSNAEIAGKILQDLYPSIKSRDSLFPLFSGSESETIQNMEDNANPFNFKLR